MKKSTKDQVAGLMHQAKGHVKEAVGKLTDNPKLEAEGKVEEIAGRIQEKKGQMEVVLGK